MPPKHGRPRTLDHYAEHRCVNCRHLRYAGQKPGDPCQVCECTNHVVPAERKAAGQ